MSYFNLEWVRHLMIGLGFLGSVEFFLPYQYYWFEIQQISKGREHIAQQITNHKQRFERRLLGQYQVNGFKDTQLSIHDRYSFVVTATAPEKRLIDKYSIDVIHYRARVIIHRNIQCSHLFFSDLRCALYFFSNRTPLRLVDEIV